MRAAGRARQALIASFVVIDVIVVVIVILLVAGGGNDRPGRAAGRCSAEVAEGSADPGDRAPSFRLPTLEGGCFRLDRQAGRPVVVNFWASWCNPCRKEFPLLARVAEEHGGDLAVVGVTYRDIEDDSRRFAEEQDAEWPLAIDDDGVVARAYRVNSIPQTIFLRRDGTVATRIFGELTRKELNAEIRRLLQR